MDDGLEGWIGDDGFVEGIFLRDVFYEGEVELRFGVFGVGLFDFVGFFLRADGCYYAVPVLEEDVEDVGGDEAGAAC